MVINCLFTDNQADRNGGGNCGGRLRNCVLTRNSASAGGGAAGSDLHNCTLTGNSASSGGGATGGALYNCIAYFNSASSGPNYSGSTFAYSCTSPLPPGPGNLDADPRLASSTHLSVTSPCVGAGSSAYASGLDIDGEPWADPPCVGVDQVLLPAIGPLSLQIEVSSFLVGVAYPVRLVAHNPGPVLATVWDFGNGVVVSNQAYTSLDSHRGDRS